MRKNYGYHREKTLEPERRASFSLDTFSGFDSGHNQQKLHWPNPTKLQWVQPTKTTTGTTNKDFSDHNQQNLQ